MATLLEQYDLRKGNAASDGLRSRVSAAVAVKAAAILALATPTAKQLAWALDAITAPEGKERAFLNHLLAANAALAVSAILAVSDANIQSAVNAAVDKLTA